MPQFKQQFGRGVKTSMVSGFKRGAIKKMGLKRPEQQPATRRQGSLRKRGTSTGYMVDRNY